MQFSQIVGDIDPKIVAAGERQLTKVFIELGAGIDYRDTIGTGLGGDPLIFALVVPAVHIATTKVPTCATNGKAFYWNPEWLATKSLLGVRLSCMHESCHALYMHPQRVGRRNLPLWNIAVDYLANGDILQDLYIRKRREFKSQHSRISEELLTKRAEEAAHKLFVQGLGNYATLAQCIEMFKHPNAKVAGMEHWVSDGSSANSFKFFYADPHLPETLKRPEKIYDLLFPFLEKCPECGKLGLSPSRKMGAGGDKDQPGQGAGKEQPGKGSSQGDAGQCGTCGGGGNVLDFGELIDEHMESAEDQQETARRINTAFETAKLMSAGNVPANLVAELGLLTSPKIRWQDFVRTKCSSARNGNAKNDWSRYRTRPLAMGLMIPKKKSLFATAICLLDTSISMGKDNMALGISQLQSLDDRAEITLVCADVGVYWDKAVKLKSCKADELAQIKPVGSGGTLLHAFFNDYEKKLGKADLLIVITDGGLSPRDIELMQKPKVETVWLLTSTIDFKPKFGRVFQIDQ